MIDRPILDIYKSRIVLNDIYFVTKEGKVSFDNICRYVEERFSDFKASEIENDNELIEYISNRYFYDCLKHETINHEFWI